MSQKFKTSIDVSGSLTLSTIDNSTINTGKFIVSDNGVIKYRTASELLSDIGAQPAGSYAASSHTHDDRYYTETEIGNFFSGASAISGYNKTNWDTAYGWGNHASVGYLTSATLPAPLTSFSTSAWAGTSGYPGYTFVGGNSRFGFSSSGGIVDIYADGNFYATDSSYRVWHAGDFSSTNISNWNTAYGWGNHASAGYALANGTTNYIPKFTASGTIGNSLIFDNGTNVGIGTTSPSEKLEVNGNVRILQSIVGGGYAPSGTSYSSYAIGGNIGGYGGFNFNTRSDVDADAFGSVGISLEPDGGVFLYNYSLDYIAKSYISFNPYDFVMQSGGDFLFRTKPSTTYQTSLIIKSSGNVGIGTTSPSATLEVSSSNYTGIAISRSIQNAGVYIQAKGYDTGNIYRVSSQITFDQVSDTFWVNGGISFATASSGSLVTRWKILTDGTFQSNGAGKIETSSSNLTLNAPFGDIYLMPQSTKNVGIGTTTPSEKLDVNGNIKAIDIIDQQGISIYLKLKTISGNVTLDNSYHNKIVRITASCTITIPTNLRTDFNCTFEVIGAYTAQFVDASGVTTSAPFGRYLKTDLTAMFYCTGTASNYRLNGSLAIS